MLKKIRKWSRILHRDIGFFFIGSALIYGVSGIALNHMSDWNPNYSVKVTHFTSTIPLQKTSQIKTNILQLLDEVDDSDHYKKHYFPKPDLLKIFLKGGSSIIVNTNNGEGTAEYLKKRPLFYQSNYLHYNPSRAWTWFSDAFAIALILFALSSLFMTKGKNGILGRGGIYALLGIIIPLLFLLI